VYVVRTGDHLDRVAAAHGLDPDVVWNLPENADLRQLRKKPNILCEGDILYLPDPPARQWLTVAIGGTNSFVAKPAQTTFSVAITYDGKPLANEPFTVHGFPQSDPQSTDGDGKLTIVVDLAVSQVTVEFPRLPLVRTFRIGHLDPLTEPSGLTQRLVHLGYLSPRSAEGGSASNLEGALRAFQRDQQLPETGVADDATLSALESEHGC
jgi:hypothetical protein